jgi:hypothetical protein
MQRIGGLQCRQRRQQQGGEEGDLHVFVLGC